MDNWKSLYYRIPRHLKIRVPKENVIFSFAGHTTLNMDLSNETTYK